MKNKIYLIGFMGSGKSTIGKLLSEMLRESYVDTDTFIEKNANMQIKDMFSIYGECFFRGLETEALKRVKETIISTGGGIIKKDVNIEEMKKNGIIIYLKVSFEEVCKRLEEDDTRPLWNKEDLEEKRALFEERLQVYEENSNHIITCDSKDVNLIAEEIKCLIIEK